ncbi:uncharacterized protein LOC124328337 [Daphnia pulicaria]|uniref:uncharacterized protein LOC124328337 n=1 Tax=Daphnia pulicaria TaxID=35523 RepID=UPI001EE9C080|nr:uncharacterized protein LOC124328337 [Daphnia pulicaria]
MKFVFALILVVFVTDVKPLFEEVSDIIFKKYATMKILEDCYGKPAINNMLSEVALAFARCRGKPSFLPILEQLGTFNAEQIPEIEPEMVTEIISTTTSPPPPPPTSNSPVKEVPLVVFQKPVAPQVPPHMLPQNFYDPYPRYEQYGNRRYWLPGYYPPGKSQFQQRFPYDEESYYYSMLSNPEDYRWKRAEHRTMPEDEQENLPAEQENPPAPALNLPNVSSLFAKQQAILGNMTCVMKEIGFIGEDMQPLYDNIRKRIDDLPVTAQLKTDLIEGIETCQQFSSCMPVKTFGDIPILRDIVKPYTFFKCFKGKKIEACMKKDMREKFLSLLSGASSGRAKQSREYGASEKEESIESIFNMVYGFDMNKSSDDIF